MKVYKKVRAKGNECYPLFIGKNKPFRFGEWLHCEFLPTKGFAPRSVSTDNGEMIGGWHCCYTPNAPHLADILSNGEVRVWIECEARGRITKYDRPESQGGAWLLAEEIMPLRIISAEEVTEINRKVV